MQFLPASLTGWLALVVELAAVTGAIAAFVWRVVRAPLLASINGLGGRVTAVELSVQSHDALLGKADRELHDSKRDLSQIHDRIGRLEGGLERLITALERNRDARIEGESELKERLVRIETKVDLLKRRRTNE